MIECYSLCKDSEGWRVVAVTISKEVVEVAGIKEEETIRIELEKQRTKYVGALKGIGKFNRKERTDHRDG